MKCQPQYIPGLLPPFGDPLINDANRGWRHYMRRSFLSSSDSSFRNEFQKTLNYPFPLLSCYKMIYFILFLVLTYNFAISILFSILFTRPYASVFMAALQDFRLYLSLSVSLSIKFQTKPVESVSCCYILSPFSVLFNVGVYVHRSRSNCW